MHEYHAANAPCPQLSRSVRCFLEVWTLHVAELHSLLTVILWILCVSTVRLFIRSDWGCGAILCLHVRASSDGGFRKATWEAKRSYFAYNWDSGCTGDQWFNMCLDGPYGTLPFVWQLLIKKIEALTNENEQLRVLLCLGDVFRAPLLTTKVVCHSQCHEHVQS